MNKLETNIYEQQLQIIQEDCDTVGELLEGKTTEEMDLLTKLAVYQLAEQVEKINKSQQLAIVEECIKKIETSIRIIKHLN